VNRVADPTQLPVLDAMRETARASCVPEPPGFSWDVDGTAPDAPVSKQ